MPSAKPIWITNLVASIHHRNGPSSTIRVSEDDLQHSALASDSSHRKSVLRFLLGKPAPVRNSRVGNDTSPSIRAAAQDDLDILYGRSEIGRRQQDGQSSSPKEDVYSGFSSTDCRARSRTRRPQTSDGVRHGSIAAPLSDPLDRETAKPDPYQWQQGLNGPELVSSCTSSSAPANRSSGRSPLSNAESTFRPETGKADRSIDLVPTEGSSAPQDGPRSARTSQPTPLAMPPSSAKGDQPLINREQRLPTLSDDDAPVEAAAATPWSMDPRSHEKLGANGECGPADGHWTAALEGSSSTMIIEPPIREDKRSSPRVYTGWSCPSPPSPPRSGVVANNASDPSLETGGDASVFCRNGPTRGLRSDGSFETSQSDAECQNGDADDRIADASPQASEPSRLPEASPPSSHEAVAGSDGNQPSGPNAAASTQAGTYEEYGQSLSADLPSDTTRPELMLLTKEVSPLSNELSPSAVSGGPSSSLRSLRGTPSQHSSPSSTSTPRRISFAPTVRCRDRPAPKGLIPPGMIAPLAADRSVTSGEAESDFEGALTRENELNSRQAVNAGRRGWSSSRHLDKVSESEGRLGKRKSRKRPSTAPASLNGDDGAGSSSTACRDSEDAIPDGDSEAESDSGSRGLRWAISKSGLKWSYEDPLKRGKDQRQADSDDEDAPLQERHWAAESPAQINATNEGTGSGSPSPPSSALRTANEIAAESLEATGPARSEERELLFYPGTLILVREDVEVEEEDEMSDSGNPSGKQQASAETNDRAEDDSMGSGSGSDGSERRGSLLGLRRWSIGRKRPLSSSGHEASNSPEDDPDAMTRVSTSSSRSEALEVPLESVAAPRSAGTDTTAVGSPEDILPASSPSFVDCDVQGRSCEGTAVHKSQKHQGTPSHADHGPIDTGKSDTDFATKVDQGAAAEQIETLVSVPPGAIDEEGSLVLWHGNPPDMHRTKARSRAFRLFEKVARVRSLGEPASSSAVSRSFPSSKTGRARKEGQVFRIVSREGQLDQRRKNGILLPETVERSYYYPGRTRMEMGWQDLDRERSVRASQSET